MHEYQTCYQLFRLQILAEIENTIKDCVLIRMLLRNYLLITMII